MNDRNEEVQVSIKAGSVVRVFFLILLFILLFYIRDLILVVLAAVVIASAMEPFTLWFGKYHMARLPAVILMYISLALVVAGLFYFFLPSLLNDTSNFLSAVPRYLDSVSIWNPLQGDGTVADSKEIARSLSEDLNQSREAVQSFSPNATFSEVVSDIQGTLANLSQGFVKTVSVVFGGILSSILIIVLSFYLAVQEDGIAKFLRFVTPLRHEKYVVGLWKRVQAKIGLWMQGQLVLGLVIGILVYLVLAIFGPTLHVGNPILLAFLAAVFEIIPLFGPILSAIPAVVSSYSGGGIGPALVVVGIYLVIHQLENNLIYPLVVKKIVGVPPILVILALVIGWKLAGFLGLLLSVPVATTLVEYFSDMEKDKLSKSAE